MLHTVFQFPSFSTRLSKALVVGMAVMLFGCATLLAQISPKPETDLAKVPGGTYELDVSHANVTFEIMHMNFSNYVGRFNSFTATADFDPKNPAASKATVKIDPASIDTNHEVLEKDLRGKNFLEVETYPEITFVSDRLEITGANSGKLHGQFSLHGVTKPLILDVQFNGGGKNPMSGKFTLGFVATGSLKRSDYGMTYIIPIVADELTFRFNGEFVKK
jgi:polyisoprenoid-binding protein YceI